LELSEVANFEVGKVARGVLDERGKDGVLVEADEDGLGQAGHLATGLQGVPDDGSASNGEQWPDGRVSKTANVSKDVKWTWACAGRAGACECLSHDANG
jgi:hypothetical protein